MTGAPPAPPAALAVFGAGLPTVTAYVDLLATVGVERGLIGPREAPRLWERHLLNCAGLTTLLPSGATVIDLGSGAGLPGLVLAACRPDLHLVLVEPLLRRASFLIEAVSLLGLGSVEVRRDRAEDLRSAGLAADAVVARAVAPLERLAGWALPLLRPGGNLLALKGERAQEELAEARPALARLGSADARLVEVGDPNLETWSRVLVVTRAASPEPGPVTATRSRQRARARR